MKRNDTKLSPTIAMMLTVLVISIASPAQAVTVNMNGTDVTSIQGFEPGGALFGGQSYDVSFAVGTYAAISASHTFIFLNESPKAGSFVFQLNQLLDSVGATSVNTLAGYAVPDIDQGSDVDIDSVTIGVAEYVCWLMPAFRTVVTAVPQAGVTDWMPLTTSA